MPKLSQCTMDNKGPFVQAAFSKTHYKGNGSLNPNQ